MEKSPAFRLKYPGLAFEFPLQEATNMCSARALWQDMVEALKVWTQDVICLPFSVNIVAGRLPSI